MIWCFNQDWIWNFVRGAKQILGIRESVDSLCRDGADMPTPPYIGKACTRRI